MADYDYGQLIDDFELGVDVMPDEDLTAYIERRRREFESKADGGSIGIEVLFTDKMKNGGRVPAVSGGFLKLLAEGASKGKKGIMELVESGKGRFDEFVETMNQSKKPSDSFTPQNITADLIDGPITVEKMANLDSKTLNIIKNTYDNGLYKEMPEILKAGNLLERFTKVVKGERIVDYERAESILGVPLKGDETLNEIFKIEFDTRPVEKLADGGRVGLFMGGDPLTGQALSIYNSMNAYGFDDQAIANALTEQGLYTAPGSGTPETPPTTIQPIGFQSGNDGPYAGQVVDQTDYGFNKKNYAPGQKLEINPAAVGMSFYDAEPMSNTKTYGQGIDMNKARSFEENKALIEKAGGIDKIGKPVEKNFIGRTIDSFMGAAVPGKQLSQFTSPGTGGTLTGPAELGFMSQNIEGIPGNLTREDLRGMYDNYNKFTGRTSNFANARVKGTAGNLINAIPYIGTLKKGAEAIFGPQGDKSLQSKYTVDGAGFGSTGARDEFGLATFNKKDGFLGLTGNTTRNYTDRMSERLGELTDFFGSRIEGFDINNIDAATFNKMSKINGFYAKQVQAYKDRIEVERINREQKEKEKKDAIAASEAAARGNYTPGGSHLSRGQSGGGLGLSQAQAQSVSQANKDAGYASFSGLKDGGLATMFTRRR